MLFSRYIHYTLDADIFSRVMNRLKLVLFKHKFVLEPSRDHIGSYMFGHATDRTFCIEIDVIGYTIDTHNSEIVLDNILSTITVQLLYPSNISPSYHLTSMLENMHGILRAYALKTIFMCPVSYHNNQHRDLFLKMIDTFFENPMASIPSAKPISNNASDEMEKDSSPFPIMPYNTLVRDEQFEHMPCVTSEVVAESIGIANIRYATSYVTTVAPQNRVDILDIIRDDLTTLDNAITSNISTGMIIIKSRYIKPNTSGVPVGYRAINHIFEDAVLAYARTHMDTAVSLD